MAVFQDPNPHVFPRVDEIPERLNEQHNITTKTLGFLVHPNIPLTSSTLKIADIATGTGIWLLDVAETLPLTCQFTGFDFSSSAFPKSSTWPANVTFKTQDMLLPFPDSELGSYDIVAIRFVSVATTRTEWAAAIKNLMTLLKPGGWLQWIDSCNFKLYNSVAGSSRKACREMYKGLSPYRAKEDLVIGMMMQDFGEVGREEVFIEAGLVDVSEDIFSTDRLMVEGVREMGTKNMILCWRQYLDDLIKIEESGWTRERVETLCEEALSEVDAGVYHTLDQVCIVGRKL